MIKTKKSNDGKEKIKHEDDRKKSNFDAKFIRYADEQRYTTFVISERGTERKELLADADVMFG